MMRYINSLLTLTLTLIDCITSSRLQHLHTSSLISLSPQVTPVSNDLPECYHSLTAQPASQVAREAQVITDKPTLTNYMYNVCEVNEVICMSTQTQQSHPTAAAAAAR